jgi:hypothetical protein
LPRLGAGAFTPGAVAVTILTLRAQSLAPGGRLRWTEPVTPARFGRVAGYWARFQIEDRDLGRRELALFVMPGQRATTVFQLTGAVLSDDDIGRLRAILAASFPASDRQ